MGSFLDSAMRKAAALTVRQKPAEAMQVIQRALSEKTGAAAPEGSSAAQPKAVAPSWTAALPQAAADLMAEGSRKAPSLGDVLHVLHSGGVPPLPRGFAPHIRPVPAVGTPEGAQFVARSFSCDAGARDYKLFIPSAAQRRGGARGLPLIVMLHGCTQNPDDFALGTGMNALAEARGCLVAYPKQASSANNYVCWNWFNLKDQDRDSGEPAIIAGIARDIVAEFGVDQDRVFVAGLSAGGAMAAILGAAYPDLFDAAGVHSGLPRGAATDAGSAFKSMRNGASPDAAASAAPARLIVFHGDDDKTVHPLNGELIVAAARSAIDAPVETAQSGRSAGGIAYKRTVIASKRGAGKVEYWRVADLGHAWSGGDPAGSYTNPHGPDASREMMRFFLD